MAKIIVGIDFGTSTTAVRWRKEDSDEVHVLNDSNGRTVIDTAIFIPDDNGEWLYGRRALNQANRKGKLVRNFKMDLIEPDLESQAEIYVRKFMEHVYQVFAKETAAFDYDSMDVYVSYPVKWSTEKKTLMKKIISDVGFGKGEGVSIIGKTEPAAAAIELMRINISNLLGRNILKANVPFNVMMLDMGAGTSDLFLLQMTMTPKGEIIIPEDKIVQYPVSKQPYNCGGREIDAIISQEILDYLSKGMGRPAKAQWFDENKAKNWKDQTLSDVLKENRIAELPSAVQPIIEQAQEFGQWDKTIGDYKMSAAKFEALTESHWANLYKLLNNGMAKFKHECHIGAEDIDIIFLTGGHSQWYCVPKLFNGEGINGTIASSLSQKDSLNFIKVSTDIKSRILQGGNPQETVANGLCWPNWIHIPNRAENNVWVRMNVNGICTEYKQIINAGDLLPQVKYVGRKKDNIPNQYPCLEKEYMIRINRHTVFDSTSDTLALEVLEGDTIETAVKSRFLYKIEDLGVFGKFLLSFILLGIPLFMREDKVFCYNAYIGLNEDGTISINGDFEINGKKEKVFTDKDFNVS